MNDSSLAMRTPSAGLRRADAAAGSVVALTASHRAFDSHHERATRAEVARRLAALQGHGFHGEYERERHYAAPLYFVPSDTLAAPQAEALGIRTPHDLLGGVVPHAFVSTKVITHPLVDAAAVWPQGWRADFGPRVAQAVLAGYTAFGHADARRAGLRLLAQGAVRIKPARATGGSGQSVAVDAATLERCLEALDADELAAHGVVLEENLRDPATYSVGQVKVGRTEATYHGVQRLTANHRGEPVYGGSDLTVVRGGFEMLLALPLTPEVRLAVQQARLYHEAVLDCFEGFFASRINYDVAQGRNPSGEWRSGVLEQSWRIGGATGAEIGALELLQARPDCQRVQASCFEVYGAAAPPAGSTVYFHGVDARCGPMAKYTVAHAHADAP